MDAEYQEIHAGSDLHVIGWKRWGLQLSAIVKPTDSPFQLQMSSAVREIIIKQKFNMFMVIYTNNSNSSPTKSLPKTDRNLTAAKEVSRLMSTRFIDRFLRVVLLSLARAQLRVGHGLR